MRQRGCSCSALPYVPCAASDVSLTSVALRRPALARQRSVSAGFVSPVSGMVSAAPPQRHERVFVGIEENDRVDELPEVALAIAKYTATLTAMAELPSQAGVAHSPRRWNRLASELQRQQLILRETSFGQQAISALMDGPRPVVRVWAAGHALFWDEAKARSVLEALRDDTGVGVGSVDAKCTLIEFDKGRLNPCWEPPARG
jgi:hypothetical protein